MYIKSIQVDNVGAIKKLAIDFKFNEAGLPEPTILVGMNGSGKTLIMSSILDSLIQMKKTSFQDIPEVKKQSFYKAGKKDYIQSGSDYSFVNIKYKKDDESEIKYYDVASNNPTETIQLLQYYQINFHPQFHDNGFHRDIVGEAKGIFESVPILFFPVNRYYSPAWLVEKEDVRIKITQKFLGIDDNSIIKMDVINEIEAWILDVLLDKNLYEQNVQYIPAYFKVGEAYQPVNIPAVLSQPGKNTLIIDSINELLSVMLKVKYPNIEMARFGVSNKEHGRMLSIIVKDNDGERVVAPTFSHLSSGEAMLIALFCSIIKSHDKVGNNKFASLEDIRGIVVVDEIDLNLHIEYTKEVLPKLLKLFPKVQFIMTSHSPFLLLGMKDQYGEDYSIINLPNGELINEDEFEEVRKAYSIFINGFESFNRSYNGIQEELNKNTTPLIVTEGKTDWRHIKCALNNLKGRGYFSELDIDFHEYDDDSFSDSKLKTFLDNMKLIENKRKIVGIFDRDEGNGKNFAKKRYNYLGNKVYALSIPQPEFRQYHEGICIEMMYKDEDLLKANAEGRRIYLSSEFNIHGRFLNNPELGVLTVGKVKSYLDKPNEKIIDSEVYDIKGNSLAMSKIVFSNLISDQTSPFDQLNFDAFIPLFEAIQDLIKE